MKLKHALFGATALVFASFPALAALTYSTAAGDARLTAGLNATGTAAGASVNGQTAGAGTLAIGTSSMTTSSCTTGLLVSVVLSTNPPFSIASKVATLSGVPLTATPTAAGTAALANLCDSAGNVVGSGLTVGTSGTDIIVSTTALTTSVPVQVTSATITTQ
jgi:hypothetical protein